MKPIPDRFPLLIRIVNGIVKKLGRQQPLGPAEADGREPVLRTGSSTTASLNKKSPVRGILHLTERLGLLR